MKNDAVYQSYPTKLESWLHASIDKFIGLNQQSNSYGFGLTPPEPGNEEYSYFTVFATLTISNQAHGQVFKSETSTTFKLRNDKQAPSLEYLFHCVELATDEFITIFKQKSNGTNLEGKQIPKPQMHDIQNELSRSIKTVYG